MTSISSIDRAPTHGWIPARSVLWQAAVLLGLSVFVAYCPQAHAQNFPNRSLRIIVPFTPGGPADSIARTVGERLAARVGQPVIVENKPGASGSIGADLVAKAPADGYTLLLTQIGDSIAVSLNNKLPYNFERDLAPVSLLGETPFIVVVHPSVKAKTIKEFIALAKAQPGKLSFGSAGAGLASHLAGELFNEIAGIDAVHVPYKGQAQATADLLGGQINYMFNNPVTSLPHIKSGGLRALAVTGPARLGSAPEIPTVAESGLADYQVTAWFGVMTTAGTPAEVIGRLSQEMAAILQMPEVKDKLRAQGVDPVGSTAAEFGRVIKRDIDRWAKLIKARNINVQ